MTTTVEEWWSMAVVLASYILGLPRIIEIQRGKIEKAKRNESIRKRWVGEKGEFYYRK